MAWRSHCILRHTPPLRDINSWFMSRTRFILLTKSKELKPHDLLDPAVSTNRRKCVPPLVGRQHRTQSFTNSSSRLCLFLVVRFFPVVLYDLLLRAVRHISKWALIVFHVSCEGVDAFNMSCNSSIGLSQIEGERDMGVFENRIISPTPRSVDESGREVLATGL